MLLHLKVTDHRCVAFRRTVCNLAFRLACRNPEEPLMFKYALIAVFVLAFTDPALASYWIVRGSDKKCIVVDMEPTDKTISMKSSPSLR